tara:strand:+ start:10538 stop:11548 length:1011 start_codon:yes stop_codon:yes gene_type:complete
MIKTDTNNLNNNSTTDKEKDKINTDYNEQNNSNNLYSLIKIFVILVLYLIIYYFLGKFLPSSIIVFINLFAIFFFVLFVIVNFINYFFNFNILKELYYVVFNIKYEDEVINKLLNNIIIFNNISENDTNNNTSNNNKIDDNINNSGIIDEDNEIDIDNELDQLTSSKKPQENTDISNNIMNKEVFHIPGSRFTYNDANAICKSMNSDLASYEQLQNAQKNGANWCSYGWSQDQLAIYPTSQNKFDELNKNDKTKYDCGFVGVNGMYVNNTYMKFGANCYGFKPKKSELELSHSEVTDYKPKSSKEVIFENRVEYWKRRLGNVLITPFNKDKWYTIE